MREKYVLRNILAKRLSACLIAGLNFVSRKVFLDNLGDTTMGLNALLLSVLSMLSLLELGVGNAIYFGLYKPLAENDRAQIRAIMRLYAKIYRIIGALVLGIGLMFIPFLHVFINTELPDQILYRAYVIMVLDTSLSYYLAYRRNVFNADQKEYFTTNVDTLINLSVCCIQMVSVVLTKNYYVFLGIKMAGTLIGNMYLYVQSGKKYPYLNEPSSYQLSDEFKRTFKENVKALCLINIASYLVFGTDNLLLSRYTDLTQVFIYSNYTAIFAVVNQIFHGTFQSMQASVGNFMIVEGREQAHGLFSKLFFMNFLVTSYTSTAMLSLFSDAMAWWMGQDYVWSMTITAVLVFNNYSRYISQAAGVFKNAAGLYSPAPVYKYLPLLEGGINMAVSLFFILGCRLGVLGVFLGTSISTVVTTVACPYAVYKYYFQCGAGRYIAKYFQYTGLTILYCILSVGIHRCVRGDSLIWNLGWGLAVSAVVPIGLSCLLYHRTEEFQFVRDTVRRYCNRLNGKGEWFH